MENLRAEALGIVLVVVGVGWMYVQSCALLARL
jgi:hypothetical protein